MSEQKKCNKHGYYWVGLCCDGQIADDICPSCLKAAAPDLLAALKSLLECHLTIDKQAQFVDDDDDDLAYLIRSIMPAVRKCFNAAKIMEVQDEVEY
ncbi:hypothetical protein LCGC14_3059100, partial [marine sediment metagenome]